MSRRPFPLSGSGPSLVRSIVAIGVLALMTSCGDGNRAAENTTVPVSPPGASVSMWSGNCRRRPLPTLRKPSPPADGSRHRRLHGLRDRHGDDEGTVRGQRPRVRRVSVYSARRTLNNITAGNNLVLRLEASVPGAGTVVWAGDTAFSLAAGETKDVGKVTMNYTGTDTSPPTVLSVNPTDNATHILKNSTIRVQFSEKMASTRSRTAVRSSSWTTFPARCPDHCLQPNRLFCGVHPGCPLASGAKISVSVTNVATDMAGNKLGQPGHGVSSRTCRESSGILFS